MSALHELLEHGQSYWLDNLTRGMIRGGDLERRVRDEGLRGVTSNPAIFHKAIAGSSDYDEQILELAAAGRDAEGIYEGLVVTDIAEACDILRPVYERSDGADGFVSLEVSPYLVHDTERSVSEARRLWAEVGRPNLLIKIPGSPAGVPAIETLLAEGINVNVTLLFSLSAYDAVARAHIRAMQRRHAEGLGLDGVASVASFFLSRIDVLVDELLGQRIRDVPTSPDDGAPPHDLLGRAAVANAKLAYRIFRTLYAGEEWRELSAAGARVQRVLWASTSTKNPLYDEIRYVEPLIGPDTVNTMPEVTIRAFEARGRVVPHSVESGVEEAEETLSRLGGLGIDFDAVTEQLLNEGARKFIEPYDRLMSGLEERRASALARPAATQIVVPGPTSGRLDGALSALHEKRFVRRLYARDPSLWTGDPPVAAKIAARLGWMARGADLGAAADVDELAAFAREVREDGVRHVVLLGMGGSSLCPAVVAETFGSAPGHPELIVLDDTDPAAVLAVESRIRLSDTLFLVASKSGTTLETLSLYRYFYRRLEESGDGTPGAGFVALTDPDTPLAAEAAERGFRRWVETPPDVGGRYSALTPFGLLPMALIGVDLPAVLRAADEMWLAGGPAIPAPASPAVRLGAMLGLLGRQGRDKITFHAAPGVQAFAIWAEQLIAESTGKAGRGLIPVVGERLAEPDAYAADRVFVHLDLAGADDPETVERIAALEAAGHPIVRIRLPDREALGAEFLRWEIAVATAGAVLGLNPFDEPDVASAKASTAEILAAWEKEGTFPAEEPATARDGLEAYVGPAAWTRPPDSSSIEALLADAVRGAAEGDYVALLTYFARTPEREAAVATLRDTLRTLTRAPVTHGYGPRYLHSTGQLHKGGPASGIFLILTADAAEDLPIPDREFGFGVLQRAQALGDERALRALGRRVVRVNLGWYVEAGLEALTSGLSEGATVRR
ncbi:MAG: bifunctional transaldolase/phosoglucose isomerase [Gemmatimonadota bacterium]